MRSDGRPVWGPIEGFWHRVPVGSEVEIWSYRTTRAVEEGSERRTPGSTELYFVDGSDIVDGIGFAIEGAIYEVGE